MKHSEATSQLETEPAELLPAAPKDESNPLLPIWAKQIETAREQTEAAIVALTARFSAIVHRIDAALGTNDAVAENRGRTAEIRRNVQDLAVSKLVMA